ncbi:MAG: hypothetical protein K6A67_01445 [Bacteroidales bacterium]|nr:hypothetical protein [Bacteroidales bacterium]
MHEQIKIVATLTPDPFTIDGYLASERWRIDNPGFVIGRDGTIYGGRGEQNIIALVNVGELVKKGNSWIPVINEIEKPSNNYIPYEYCSCRKTFEMIPDRQLNALRRLLKSLLSQFHIQFPYDNQLGDICPRALAGKSGIYFASSFDSHRYDIHPQVELINLIKSLAS